MCSPRVFVTVHHAPDIAPEITVTLMLSHGDEDPRESFRISVHEALFSWDFVNLWVTETAEAWQARTHGIATLPLSERPM
jgi:hypothetical protein